MWFSFPVLISSAVLLATSVTATAEFTPAQYGQAMQQSIDLSTQMKYNDAARVLEKALIKAPDAGREDWAATILGFLGTIYQLSGRYGEAEAALNKSISEWTRLKGPDAEELVGPVAALGGLYYEASQLARAEELLTRALELQLADGTDDRLAAMLQTNLASIYFSEHKDGLATQEAQAALTKLAFIANCRDSTARNYAVLGAVDLRAGSMPEAESYFEKSLSLLQAVYGANDPHVAEGIGNLAIFYSVAGQLSKAEPLFQKAKATFDVTGGSKAFLCDLYMRYARVERQLGHKKEAKKMERRVEGLVTASAQNTLSRDVVDVRSLQGN